MTKTAKGLTGFLRRTKEAFDKADWEGAAELCEERLEAVPNSPEALFALAIIAFNFNDLALAATQTKRAFDAQPNIQEYASLLAVFHALAGDINSSAYYAKLVYTLPETPELKEIIPESFPDFSDVFQEIVETPLLRQAANALSKQAWEEAEHWFRQHLTFDQRSQEAHTGLGITLLAQGLPRAAVQSLRAARHVHPLHAQISSQLGSALYSIGRFAEGKACHRWAIEQSPDDPSIHAMSLVDRMHDPEDNAHDIAAAFHQWGRHFAATSDDAPDFNKPEPKDLLTIGYVIGNQGGTANGEAVAAILSNHDSQKFETVGFGFGALSDGANTMFQKCINRWHDVTGIDPLTLRAIINAEEVDILVDISGFGAPPLLASMGLRSAPCQVAWLESPMGTGLENIDFLLTDSILDPDTTGGGRYTEELAYLEGGAIVAETLPQDPALASRPAEAELTFASDARLLEISPRTVELWAHVLHRMPNSKMILKDRGFKDNENIDQLVDLFGDFGLAHRIDVIDEPLASKFFEQADIALMPVPFPDALSALEALWGGTPVITFAGESRHTRHTASLLHHLNMADGMVADTTHDYVEFAVSWAQDVDRRAAFRSAVRERISGAKFLDSSARAKDLEKLYQSLWQKICERA